LYSTVQKQLAFMLGRQQVFLELNEGCPDNEDLVEIMSNSHLNNHFLNLAREVSQLLITLDQLY
jgi:26S proteasome regulatory subunit N1